MNARTRLRRATVAVVAAAVSAALGAAPGAAAAAESAAEVVIAPGGVVTWSAEGTERCGQEGRSWRPLGATCWFPVDLLRAPGPMVVERWRDGVPETATVRVGDYAYPVQRITLEDDSQVHLSPEDLERVARESKKIGALWGLAGEPRFEMPLAPPLAKLPEGGRFGHRRFFNDEPRSPHSGADYAAVSGTPVHAVAAGRVALAGDFFFSGGSVFLDHGDGLVSMYFHLSELLVEEGQAVGRGDAVGKVGATGRATGPHLHFGLRWKGARVDPALLLGDPSAVPALP